VKPLLALYTAQKALKLDFMITIHADKINIIHATKELPSSSSMALIFPDGLRGNTEEGSETRKKMKYKIQ
jgi:hypothetical protein